MQYGLQFRKTAAPEVAQADIDVLTQYLLGRGWVKASVIEAELHVDERRVRAIAEASDGLIISGPGCPGYKLMTGSDELQDVDQAANRLESQANRMLLRADSLRRRARRYIGA